MENAMLALESPAGLRNWPRSEWRRWLADDRFGESLSAWPWRYSRTIQLLMDPSRLFDPSPPSPHYPQLIVTHMRVMACVRHPATNAVNSTLFLQLNLMNSRVNWPRSSWANETNKTRQTRLRHFVYCKASVFFSFEAHAYDAVCTPIQFEYIRHHRISRSRTVMDDQWI